MSEGAAGGEAEIRGGCMCGAVRYAASGQPLHTGYCHCRSCRHHSGAAVAGMLVFERRNVRITGALRLYPSSPGVQRGFCGACGTSLSWQHESLISLHIGTLDDPDAHPPTLHWRWEERSPWIGHADTLPHARMVYPDPDQDPT
ncbi:MAG: GFA family protein [Pseudomonadota bacterium]